MRPAGCRRRSGQQRVIDPALDGQVLKRASDCVQVPCALPGAAGGEAGSWKRKRVRSDFFPIAHGRQPRISSTMTYIELSDQDAFFAPLKRRRGRRPFGTRDPKHDQPLREAARLFVAGGAKSLRAALIKVLGTDDECVLDGPYHRLIEREQALRGAAECAKEIEDNDPRQRKIGSFDPGRLEDAEIGTYAFINQNSTDWERAGLAGWTPVKGFGHGEILIRRDLWGVLARGSAEEAAFHERCVAYFAEIGLIECPAR